MDVELADEPHQHNPLTRIEEGEAARWIQATPSFSTGMDVDSVVGSSVVIVTVFGLVVFVVFVVVAADVAAALDMGVVAVVVVVVVERFVLFLPLGQALGFVVHVRGDILELLLREDHSQDFF